MRLAVSIALALAACGSPPPPVGPATMPSPLSYLVQNGPSGLPLKASDPLVYRRHDWGLPTNYEIDDSALSDDATFAIQTFSFAPWGKFVAANGDGGQVAVPGADGYVRFTKTQDGGMPGIQYFVGQNCGGTGWIVFGTDAPTGSWKSLVAYLNDEPSDSCPLTLNAAFTQYRLEQVALPFTVDGNAETLTLPTVISEHYGASSIAAASSMERSYFAQGYGLVFWAAWTKTPPTADLSQRCPWPIDYSVAPAAGWYMDDCRVYTNIIPADGALTVDAFGWP